MPISGGVGYSGPREVSYLFVDGGYLRKVAEKFGNEIYGGVELPINYAALGSRFTKCFYYDCLPAAGAGERSAAGNGLVVRQREQLSAIRSLHGWHVVEGVIAGEGNRARQKQVDVQIAVDLLTHSHRRNMHTATFIAGDQDFKPLVEAVVREGIFIEIWFEESSASRDLLDAADGRMRLDPYTVQRYLAGSIQRTHPLPKRSSGSRKHFDPRTLDRSGECAAGSVDLYRDGGVYTIVRPIRDADGDYVHMEHHDLDFLERVALSTYGEITWKPAQ
ncbi:MAG: NYN domain-containing protein [Chloroflexi bacterium]|nr:NYN domain-containing protein [Chloroflexota bacterium]